MNYFDFFGLPQVWAVDKASLKKTYYANSRRFHPDFHRLSSEEEQADALEQSSHNNRGYKLLMDDDQRLHHLLSLEGVLAAEGENKVPQDFLMEIMDINEALMELEFEEDPALRAKATALIEELEQQLSSQVADLRESNSLTGNDFTRLKDYYLKHRYLLRLQEKMK
ncbi:MAG: iron-sulfur cluster co-chaperone HscB C-terminal domain-containing protein [Bacteroidota bacterium]